MGAMARPLPEDYGLTRNLIDEIRSRDEKQAELFVRVLLGGCGALWLALTLLIYAHTARRASLMSIAVPPLLGALGAGIGGLPVAILSAVVSWLVHPKHPRAAALEKYEAASAGIRVCDVCRLARGDDTLKDGVAYCGRCGAWICPDCRRRYDLRAIAALKRRAGVKATTPEPRE